MPVSVRPERLMVSDPYADTRGVGHWTGRRANSSQVENDTDTEPINGYFEEGPTENEEQTTGSLKDARIRGFVGVNEFEPAGGAIGEKSMGFYIDLMKTNLPIPLEHRSLYWLGVAAVRAFRYGGINNPLYKGYKREIQRRADGVLEARMLKAMVPTGGGSRAVDPGGGGPIHNKEEHGAADNTKTRIPKRRSERAYQADMQRIIGDENEKTDPSPSVNDIETPEEDESDLETGRGKTNPAKAKVSQQRNNPVGAGLDATEGGAQGFAGGKSMFPEQRLKLPKGLERKEAVAAMRKKKLKRDYRGFTYDPKTGVGVVKAIGTADKVAREDKARRQRAAPDGSKKAKNVKVGANGKTQYRYAEPGKNRDNKGPPKANPARPAAGSKTAAAVEDDTTAPVIKPANPQHLADLLKVKLARLQSLAQTYDARQFAHYFKTNLRSFVDKNKVPDSYLEMVHAQLNKSMKKPSAHPYGGKEVVGKKKAKRNIVGLKTGKRKSAKLLHVVTYDPE